VGAGAQPAKDLRTRMMYFNKNDV